MRLMNCRNEDFIPMHHSPGDYIEFAEEGRALVVCARDDACMARFPDGRVVTWDYRKQQLEWMDGEKARNFARNGGEQENTQSTNNMKPVTVKELEGYSDKQAIACFEGQIKKLFEPKTGTTKGRKWSFQSGFIVDDAGDEHRITFVGIPNQQDVEETKNKRVRLTPGTYKGKPSGLYMAIQGEYRNINVDTGCKIEWVNGTAREQGGDQGAEPAAAANQAVQGKSTSADTVEQRVKHYIDIMDEVVRQIGKRNPLGERRPDGNDGWLAGFSASDIKEITTGIAMSFKGQYGVYAAPIFGGSQSTDVDDPLSDDYQGEHGERE